MNHPRRLWQLNTIFALFLLVDIHPLSAFLPRPLSTATRDTGSIMASVSAFATKNTQEIEVVIAGAGIIGLCTAYYLSKEHNIASTIVDVSGDIAPAASSKAGGFLALDWNDFSSTGPLTRRSFVLHQKLADEFGAEEIQYRRLTCASIGVSSSSSSPLPNSKPSSKKLEGVEWAESSASFRSLGNTDSIAQVHPKRLCEKLWETCRENGCKLVKGKVVEAVYHESDSTKLNGARLDNGTLLKADRLLFACGPWTANILYGVKYHSVVYKTNKVLSQCVFFSGNGDPEVYVRPDSTAYCTGFPEPARAVTELPGQERVDPERVATITEAVRVASGGNGGEIQINDDPVVAQSCYLPTTDDGTSEEGCFSFSLLKRCFLTMLSRCLLCQLSCNRSASHGRNPCQRVYRCGAFVLGHLAWAGVW